MNTLHSLRSARWQRGFNLVELMVACAIAVFLLFGLVTIVQNVRQANLNQQALTQLEDEQRFAMSVITDVIQAGGYYPNPTGNTEDTALLGGGVWAAGQAFYGVHGATTDTMSVRYMTTGGDGIILCDGSSNLNAPGTDVTYTNAFTVQTAAPGVVGGLYCQMTPSGGPSAVAPGILLAPGVTSMTIWYGVKRNCALNDYNVDTYVATNNMSAVSCGGGDWTNISSVRVQLVFTNPLFGQANQPATITFQRVVEVMGRAGVHT
jgi:type IV pilus assembly protein PilW